MENIHVKLYVIWISGFLISYLEPWQPFCSAERNHLCNFTRGDYEEQFL